MTREEAIDILDDNFTVIDTHGHYSEEEVDQTLDMAIKALEQKPCEDDIITKYYWKGFYDGIRTEKLQESKRQEPNDLQWSD